MTEREKIIKVIDEWANKAVKANKFDGASVYNPHNAAELADALIAAGIGDVKDVEAEANRYEMLYKLQNRDMALAERRAHDVEHRAQVAENELKLYKLAVKIWQERYSDIRCFNFNIALRQAERELAEEEKDNGKS